MLIVKGRFIYCLVGIALGLVSLGSCGRADNRPVVVLREDDCRASWRTPFDGLGGVSALQYGKQKRIPITWGVITDWATTGNGGYSLVWSELLDYLQTAGGEAASHSVTHGGAATDASYIDELVKSKAAIEKNLPGYTCTTFLQPGSWTGDGYMDRFSCLDNAVGQAIQANYLQSQAYLGGGWRIGNPYYPYGMTNVYSVDYQAYPSIDALQATLDIVGSTPGLRFVITMHGVQESGGTTEYETRADMLKALMDRLASLRDSGQIRLATMNEAYHTIFSDNLNHIPDPGFEVCNPGPLNPRSVWQLSGDAQIKATGGVDNSRYACTNGSGSQIQSGSLILAPGRYLYSWYQRPEPRCPPDEFVRATMTSYGPPGWSNPRSTFSWASYTNSDPNAWERKEALVLIDDRLPSAFVYFRTIDGGSYGIDNVSLVSAPVDPAVSPSQVTKTITPSLLTLSWLSPTDPTVSTIKVRYSPNAHPMTPSDGYQMATVPAVPGAIQQASMHVNWNGWTCMYFSVFAIKNSGAYSPPELAVAVVDKTPPSTPAMNMEALGPGRYLKASWSSKEPDSAIYQYQYAIGSVLNGADIVPWTQTQQAQMQGNISTNNAGQLYLSVMAQNIYGFWSASDSAFFSFEKKVADLAGCADGDAVTVDGVVTAVFADCFYIETSDRTRGIKVTGSTSAAEGTQVTVSGTMTTVNGERAIAQ